MLIELGEQMQNKLKQFVEKVNNLEVRLNQGEPTTLPPAQPMTPTHLPGYESMGSSHPRRKRATPTQRGRKEKEAPATLVAVMNYTKSAKELLLLKGD